MLEPPALLPWQGAWQEREVAVPDPTRPGTDYEGTIAGPADLDRYPGLRPALVIAHGGGGSITSGGNSAGRRSRDALAWLGRDLAGHGYVTLAVDLTNTDFEASLSHMIDYLESPANPFASITDPDRIGAAGHSRGAMAVSYRQGDDDRIDTIIAMDNLASSRLCGGPLEPLLGGAPPEPRVPALGFARDETCSITPLWPDREIHKNGYRVWRDAAQPVAVVVFRGTSHASFTSGGGDVAAGTEAEFRRFSHYTRAWFDWWLLGDPAGPRRVLAGSVDGMSRDDLTSEQFVSAASFPQAGVHCEDLRDGACPRF